MNTTTIRHMGLAALIGVAALGTGASSARADHGYRGYPSHLHHGHGCATPVYSYRPVVVPSYGYGYGYSTGFGLGYPSYSTYRPINTFPLGGYGVGGFPPGASWGGGGFPPGASWGGGGRGFSLYIGR